MSRVMETR